MIDIVTTTWKSFQKFETCLNTVLEKTKFVDYKWYVWCNDAGDEIKKVIYDATHIDNILITDRVVPIYNNNNNGSFSSNNNNAASAGSGEYILFLNDDVEPLNENWLLSMVSILTNDQKVGVVGSLLLYPDQKTIQHCGVFFSQQTNNLPFHMFYRKPLQSVEKFVLKPRYYQAVTGACMLVRRKDFEAVGGFNKDFFYGFEDVCLCLEIKSKLKKNSVYTPEARLIHNEGISGNRNNNSKLQLNIDALRRNCSGKYYNDLDFYNRDANFMVYGIKSTLPAPKKEECCG